MHVSPTSNICERLFREAKLIMSATRKNMNPDSLNMLLFLKANRRLWPKPSMIQKILNDLAGFVDDDNDDESQKTTLKMTPTKNFEPYMLFLPLLQYF